MVSEIEVKGQHSWTSRWAGGIWLGVIDRSGENLIGTDNGVVKCRTMKRKAGNAQKWDIGAVNEMQGVPWEPEPDRTNVLIGIKVREWKKREVDADQVLPAEVKETRRVNKFSILPRDVDEHGVTVGCKGCLQSKL